MAKRIGTVVPASRSRSGTAASPTTGTSSRPSRAAWRRAPRPTRARGHHPPPTDPVELLATPARPVRALGAAALLRRAGIRLGWYDVRDLLFHLPRRYDDLRELSHLGDLVWAEEGTVVSARVRVEDVRVEASWRRRVQRTIARLSDETGRDRGDLVRSAVHRASPPTRAGDRGVGPAQAVRAQRWTIDNPEFQAVDGDGEVLHAGRIVPVYRFTAGLTAARLRVAIREALDRAGRAYPGIPAADLRRPTST